MDSEAASYYLVKPPETCLPLPCLVAGDFLRINAVQRSSEGDGFADVVEAADPGYDSLDALRSRSVGCCRLASYAAIVLWQSSVTRCASAF
jgi:hypothetical protein